LAFDFFGELMQIKKMVFFVLSLGLFSFNVYAVTGRALIEHYNQCTPVEQKMIKTVVENIVSTERSLNNKVIALASSADLSLEQKKEQLELIASILGFLVAAGAGIAVGCISLTTERRLFEIIAIIAGFLTAGGTGVGVGYLIWGEVNKVQVSEKV